MSLLVGVGRLGNCRVEMKVYSCNATGAYRTRFAFFQP
jgi:hypothetical protein